MTALELLKGLPSKIDERVLDGENTVFHFILSGDDGGELTLTVEDGKPAAHEGIVGEPKCVVEASDKVLLQILKKETNPMLAMLTGKLKISSKGEMMKYAPKFGLL